VKLRRLLRPLTESLMARLVASFLGVSVLTVALVATLAFVRARTALREQLFERIEALAASRENQLGRWVSEQRLEAEFLARLETLRSGIGPVTGTGGSVTAQQAYRSMLALLVDADTLEPDFREIFVLSIPGAKVLVSTDTTRRGEYRVTDQYYLEGRGRTFVQSVYPSPISGRPALTVATPLTDARGDTVAVLAAHLDLEQIDGVIADRRGLGLSGESYLVDQFNEFVSAERFGRERWLRGVQSDGIRAAVQGKRSGTGEYRNYAGVPVIGAFRWSEAQQLAVLVEIPQSEAFAPARTLAQVIVLVGLGSMVVLSVGVWLFARRIARPVLAVAAAAERVSHGDFAAHAPVVTRDEIGRLAVAFNGMTERLARLYESRERQMADLSRAAQALAEGRELLQAIVDSTPGFIVVADLEHHVLLGSRPLLQPLERTSEEVIGVPVHELLGAVIGNRFVEQAQAALDAAGPVEREHDVETAWGRRQYATVVFPLFDAQHVPYAVCGMATDITERKRTEADQHRFTEQIQHTQKLESLGVLAGGIAHDFNNLLTAILGHAEMAIGDLPAESPSLEDLERIVQAAQRASEMTNQMLAYAGRGKFVVEQLCPNRLVLEMSQLLRVSIPKKVELRYDLAENLPSVHGDRAQIQQVVMNLITNAAEAVGSEVGTIALETRVSRTAGRERIEGLQGDPLAPGEYVRITVSDTGAGMDSATLRRIFEPFFTTKFTGRGLGLAAVLGIVRGHHGALAVTSVPGQGTVFSVYLPVASTPAPASVKEESPLAPNANSGTILLVDDEEYVRSLAERALSRGGYRVLLARDGAEAVETFRKERRSIDLIVLDLTMPVMDGCQAMTAIRAIDPSVKVVLSSGFTEYDLSSRGDAGNAIFLQKPYLPSQLVEVVAGAVKR
jgi:PAS domain S-box-containing protein